MKLGHVYSFIHFLVFTTGFFYPFSKENAVLKLVALLRVDDLCPDVFIWMNILTLNKYSNSLPH